MITLIVLLAAIAISIALDLGIFNRKAHEIGVKEAAITSTIWIGFAALFGLFIYYMHGATSASEFYTVYLVEKMLSVDNLFVFMLIFAYFKTPEALKHKILMYGIVGAIVFRAIFVFAGAAIVEEFQWLLYGFGGLLIWMGIKLFIQKENEEPDVSQSFGVKMVRKYLRVVDTYNDGKLFYQHVTVKKSLTMTALVILAIELSDIIFAVDSVPAAFAITTDPVVIYSANICAILGLRALFFLLDAISKHLRFLNYGLGIILAFIGGKMLAADFYHIDTNISLAIVMGLLTGTVMLSLLMPKAKEL